LVFPHFCERVQTHNTKPQQTSHRKNRKTATAVSACAFQCVRAALPVPLQCVAGMAARGTVPLEECLILCYIFQGSVMIFTGSAPRNLPTAWRFQTLWTRSSTGRAFGS
jgi:hypothetical protein